MSNFSDFTVFDMESDVSLHYVDEANDVLACDALIIPGSKNTIFDMLSLQKNGLDKIIVKFSQSGKPVVGICGGYQILGKTISDPYEVESIDPTIDGLGLLNVVTTMAQDKRTVQNKGEIINGDARYISQQVTGYEIHMGETNRLDEETKPLMMTEDGHEDGAVNADKTVFGSYFHGIFDNDTFRNAFLNHVRAVKGLSENEEGASFEAIKDAEYDRLAKHVKENLNMPEIMRILDESRTENC